jgi:hypothetical protein
MYCKERGILLLQRQGTVPAGSVIPLSLLCLQTVIDGEAEQQIFCRKPGCSTGDSLLSHAEVRRAQNHRANDIRPMSFRNSVLKLKLSLLFRYPPTDATFRFLVASLHNVCISSQLNDAHLLQPCIVTSIFVKIRLKPKTCIYFSNFQFQFGTCMFQQFLYALC